MLWEYQNKCFLGNLTECEEVQFSAVWAGFSFSLGLINIRLCGNQDRQIQAHLKSSFWPKISWHWHLSLTCTIKSFYLGKLIFTFYLQHFIRTSFDAWWHMSRREGDLLDLCKVVHRISVQHETTDIDEWKLSLRPNLQYKHSDIRFYEHITYNISQVQNIRLGKLGTSDGSLYVSSLFENFVIGEFFCMICTNEINLSSICHGSIVDI